MSLRSLVHRIFRDEPPSSASHRIELDPTEVYSVLSASRRRHVIRTLAARGAIPMRELVAGIGSLEQHCAPSELLTQDRKRVRIGLYQQHLPMMENLGVIEWESSSRLVCAGHSVDGLAEVIEFVDDATGSWVGQP